MGIYSENRKSSYGQSRPNIFFTAHYDGEEVRKGHNHSPLTGDLKAGKKRIHDHGDACHDGRQFPDARLKGKSIRHGQKPLEKGISKPANKSYVQP